ncbi:putative bifunctional diguanylate cyclase/phosphodiesterase [Marinomonas colpomeniae]|uniref:Bifunctional diguanylate cyclase/phosphodiesterase n=1 Tax=Marinomonas colpomeniae TaxID=2774408 RepID=A0ABR8NUD4_9GAMM|nr:bifunctional diguanylate cyclase/phosphodiesterase [Marinomonas colpomeniae]MBD5769658.1 bifunctional diguanylate cyclase/phosphodiesterase [Marinomonas colpomeniae]
MFLKNNFKLFLFLIVFTFSAVFLYRFGYFDTSLSIPVNDPNTVFSITSEDVTDSLVDENSDFKIQCSLDAVEKFNFCGVGIKLSNSMETGIDITRFDRLELELSYSAPVDRPRVKVSFRNYNPVYSTPTDFTSLKFNTITFDASKYDHSFIVSLDFFQVESWWIDQYNIDFKDSQTDFSNISRLDFLTYNMPVTGVYELNVKKVILRGERISEYDLFKLIFTAWLVIGFVVLLRQHNALKKRSITDLLTGLYNRRGIQQKLQKISSDNEVFMFYININEFKKINDTYGHNVGDKFLIYFSRLIEDKVKGFKGISHISRYSGDEFLIVFDNISETDMRMLAYSITAALKESVVIDPYKISVSISMGVSKTQAVKKNFDTLLARAGAAMYHVKSNNLLSFQEFDEPFSKNIYFKKKVSEFIKEALSNDEFYLNYMPIYDTKNLEIKAFEVLLRCSSESMKGTGPDVFIPIAEEYNLIRVIDLWVIESTFKNIKNNYDFLMKTPVVFCINISSEELKNPLFKKNLVRLLDEYEIPPEWIELELTETSFVEIDQKSIDVLSEIRTLGVNLSLDDFGTGYISFNQLINYPVNNLKIDKSFVDLLETENESGEMIVRAILSMADSYELHTIAEGVETAEQYAYLLELGCHYVQGYLLSKPLSWPLAKALLIEPNTENLKNLVKFS